MATKYSLGLFTLSSSGQTRLTSEFLPSSKNDTISYYATLNVQTPGAITVQFMKLTSEYCWIEGKISTSSVLDGSSKWPSESTVVESGALNPPAGSFVEAFSFDALTTGTYYLFFNNTSTASNDIQAAIVFSPFDPSTRWSKVYRYLGTIDSATSVETQQQDYKLYCFGFNASSGRYTIKQTCFTQTEISVTNSDSNNVFNHGTGEVYENKCVSGESSDDPGIEKPLCKIAGDTGTTITINDAGRLYIWIRQQGLGDGSISFTISPPGAEWTVGKLEDATTVPVSPAVNWPEQAGDIREKTIEYIELTFVSPGTYSFKATTSEQIQGYLTSNLSTDANGVPLQASVLASDTGSSSGFEFSYSGIESSPTTYYLMIRTPTGSPNAYSFDLSIESSSWNFGYVNISASVPLPIEGNRTIGYTIPAPSAEYQYGIYFKARFTRVGTVNINYSLPNYGGPSGVVLYLTEDGYGYDPTRDYNPATGAPYVDSSHSSEAAGSSSKSFRSDTTKEYYVWVRGTPPNTGGFISINITFDVPEWQYDTDTPSWATDISSVIDPTDPPYGISEKHGVKVRVSFFAAGSATIRLNGADQGTLYITPYNSESAEGDYGFDSQDGVPYINFSYEKATGSRSHTITVTSGTRYWIWISPLSGTSSESATLTIIPPNAPWVSVNLGIVDRPSNESYLDNTSKAATAYYFTVIFADSGEAVFRSMPGLALNLNAWITDTSGDIDPNTGIPTGTIYARDDDSGSFTISYNVTAGVSYRCWWRADSKTETGRYVVYIKPPPHSPTPTPTDIGLWIGTASHEWHKLKIYIGNSSHEWVEYKPYIAVGSPNAAWIDEYRITERGKE